MRAFWQWLIRIDSLDNDVRHRGSMLVFLAVALIGFATLTIPLAAMSIQPMIAIISEGGSILLYAVALYLARRGWVSAGGFLLLAVLALAVLLSVLGATDSSSGVSFLLLPVIVAGLILRPAQIWLVLVFIVLGLGVVVAANPLLQSQINLAGLASTVMLLGIATLLSFIGARAMSRALLDARQARQTAEQAAERLVQANSELEQHVDQRTHALTHALKEGQAREARFAELISQNEQQASTIREMSVPVIPISDTMLIMPLVGALDSIRLDLIQQQALQAIQKRNSHLLILDITGVPIIDTQVAKGLLTVTQATRLLGADVVLVGVRPEVAQTIVGLGLTLEGLRTAPDLQSLLQQAENN